MLRLIILTVEENQMLNTKVLLRLRLLCKIVFGCVSDMSVITWANEQICVFVCVRESDCVCVAVYSVNIFFSLWGKIWVPPGQLKLKIVETIDKLISSFNEVTARNFPSCCGSHRLWRKKKKRKEKKLSRLSLQNQQPSGSHDAVAFCLDWRVNDTDCTPLNI